MTTIPASAIVNVVPSVLGAGGNAIDLSGLILTANTRVPIGTVKSFGSAADVAAFFGASATEASIAIVYFNGFDGSTVKPGALLFAQYNQSPVSAYLRGGPVALTLAQLQALNAAISVTIDGVVKSSTVNLSAATSFSNAAEIIGAGLAIHGVQAASVTASISSTTMTVTAIGSGAIPIGGVLTGTGVTANTYVLAQLTGPVGGSGTYTVSASQTVGSETITAFVPGVQYDSVSTAFEIVSGTTGAASTITFASGALATSLLLTQATGAVLSQGADAAVTATFMAALIATTQNWATFMLAFDPDGGSGNAFKLTFAQWVSGTNNRYAFVCWDTDLSPSGTVPATASLGYLISQASYNGTCLIGEDTPDANSNNLLMLAAFVCGSVASINFAQTNGRTTLAFRSQSGLLASVTSQTAMDNMIANGYNFYGAYATANDTFVFFYDGSVSGPFEWMDSYINQIWLNNSLQLAALSYMANALSIPFNAAGDAQIDAALADPIVAGDNFGAFRPGVALSSAQISEINTAAGSNIAGTLQTQGWFLSIQPAVAAVREARGPRQVLFFYVDGQSVQKINIASIDVA